MSDLLISTPSIYKSGPDVLEEFGEVVSLFANTNKKVLLIFSGKAKEKIGAQIYEQLKLKDILYKEEIFTGFPSERQAKEYTGIAEKEEVDVLIGLGGGRTMDVTKAAGTFAKRPVITVPTIAATCAAWAAVSILYTDEGDYDRGFMNPKSPVAILADTKVIAKAPIRYLKAGMADTLAKWYEPSYKDELCDVISAHGAKLAYDTIRNLSKKVLAQAEKDEADEDTIRIVDAIIYLAGFVGSFIGTKAFSGIAHPFYHNGRGVLGTRQKLHGEVVAYGLVLQGAYEKKSYEELLERIQLLDSLDNLFTSKEIGYTGNEDYEFVVRRMRKENPSIREEDGKEIVEAFRVADSYVERFRREK